MNITFNIDNGVVEYLKAKAVIDQTDITTILAKAISLYKFVEEKKSEGYKLLIENDGNIRKVIF